MSDPFISVIIPVYNAEKYLHDCVNSILEQTYPHFEIICVDDGSTDNSVSVLKGFNNPKIKIIQQPNQGVSSARNTGVDNARGAFLTFVDSDDLLHPRFLEVLLSVYHTYHSHVIGCKYKTFKDIPPSYTTKKKSFIKCYRHPLFRYLSHTMKYHTTVWGKLYHKSVFEHLRFDPEISYGEDTQISLQLLTQVDSVSYVSMPLYGYRENAASLTQSSFKPKMTDDHILSFLKLTAFIRQEKVSPFLRFLMNRRLTNRCFRWFCFKPYQKDKENYPVLWEKYLPVMHDLIKEGKFKPSYLRLYYRFLFFLWQHKYWNFLKKFL